MPKFTLHEMKSFIANYLNSAKPPNVVDASFFLLESVMNSVMRIIVYLKTGIQNEPYDNQCAWAFVENTIVNFLDAVNVSITYLFNVFNNYKCISSPSTI